MAPSTLPRPSRVFPRSLSRVNPAQRGARRARDAEYQSIWQLFSRCAMKDAYQRATIANRKTMLKHATRDLLNKRRRQGRTMCHANVDELIKRHLEREQSARSRKRIGYTGETEAGNLEGDLLSVPINGDKENGDQVRSTLAKNPDLISPAQGLAPFDNTIRNDCHPPLALNGPITEGTRGDQEGQSPIKERVSRDLETLIQQPNRESGHEKQANISSHTFLEAMQPHLYALEEQVAKEVRALRAENDDLLADNMNFRREIDILHDGLGDLGDRFNQLERNIVGMGQQTGGQIAELRRVAQWLLNANKVQGQPASSSTTSSA